jgi:hypothetical protein
MLGVFHDQPDVVGQCQRHRSPAFRSRDTYDLRSRVGARANVAKSYRPGTSDAWRAANPQHSGSKDLH